MPTPAPLCLKSAPLVFLLLWSSGFVVLKIGLAHADPLTFLALRYACVVALLAPLLPALRPPMPASPRAWTHLAMVGLLLQAGYFGFTYLALAHGISAGGVALITSLQPILVGLLAPAIARERVDARRWAGLTLGVLGAGLVIVAKASVDLQSAAGLAYAVAALLCITGGTLYEKRHGTDTHPVVSNLVQYSVGLLVTAPLAVWLEPMRVEWTGALFGSLAYLVVGNSLVAISAAGHAASRRGLARVRAVLPGAALLRRDRLCRAGRGHPGAGLAGMALAALGILLVTRARPAAAR